MQLHSDRLSGLDPGGKSSSSGPGEVHSYGVTAACQPRQARARTREDDLGATHRHLHVDDFLVSGPEAEMSGLWRDLASRFQFEPAEVCTRFLGLKLSCSAASGFASGSSIGSRLCSDSESSGWS